MTVQPQLAPNNRFAGFVLLKELSRGSLGTLFLARETSGERVLLRVVANAEKGGDALRVRVKRDLERLSGVDHPGVATLIANGEAKGHLYYALRFPGNSTLLNLVKRERPLVGDELVWLAQGLAAGIGALHGSGLFHGDLWPGKVAVTQAGPVLVELGWSRRFRAPERKASALEFTSDWRGLGACLVYAATGVLPKPHRGGDGKPVTDGSLDVPESWDPDAMGMPPSLSELVNALLGPRERRPSIMQIQETLAEIELGPLTFDSLLEPVQKKKNDGTPSEDELPVPSQPISDRDTILTPVDSSDEAQCEDLGTVTIDPTIAPTSQRLTSSRSDSQLPTYHVLRQGYELAHKRVLGKGGMGIVHLVFDPGLGRSAALKLIRGTSSESRILRFQRETRVTARLDHPCVPPVYEAGISLDGQDYMLMQYVDGESLANILAARQLHAPDAGVPRELLHALVKVAETVAYAHSRRIVHRDLKPANIMLGAFGEVFLMDWGLARDLSETSEEDAATHVSGMGRIPIEELEGITQEGAILGTPGYIPPEQAYGREIDGRADVFALGAVLTEILTGRPPVVGETVIETLELTRRGQIESPRQRDQSLSPELEAIARGATAFDRDERYPSAQSFAADLRAYLEGRHVSTYSYSFTEWVRLVARRHPTLSTSLVIVVVLTLVGAAQVSRVRAQERADRERDSGVLIEQGRASLAKNLPAEARMFFIRALALDENNREAVIGKHEADQQVNLAQDTARARALIAEGLQHVAQGHLNAARRAYEQAVTLEGAPPEASLGLVEVKAKLAEAEARERVRAQELRDASLGRRHLIAAKRLRKRRDYAKAQVELIKANAFGSEEARGLLVKNGEQLVELRLKSRQKALKEREAQQARKLVLKARAYFKRGKLNETKVAFLQALAFQGGNKDAQRGLVFVDRKLQSLQEKQSVKERRQDAELMRKRGRRLLKQGRATPDSVADDARALEAYFAALVAFERALAFLPEDVSLREEKLEAVREVATFLRLHQQPEFSEFLLRYGGAKKDEPIDPREEDPVLEIREVDATTLRNAFGGNVRFSPTDAFAELRKYLHSLEDRYKVLIQVRSKASRSTPPKVSATGLWVRVEDQLTNTIFPLVKLPFEGGPYFRTVRVGQTGRVVGPWNRAHSLDVAAEEARVLTTVKTLIKGKRKP
jgi:serine/threonine protein kinase